MNKSNQRLMEKRMINSERAIFLVVLFMFASLNACQTATIDQSPPEPQKITVQLQPYLAYSPFFIAEEEGYFDEQGLDVEFVRVGSSEAIVAITKGDLDVMATFLTPGMFNSMAQGEEIRIVGGKGFVNPNTCTVNGILVRKDLIDEGRFDDLNNLEGMRIDISPFSIEYFFMTKILETYKVSLKDMVFLSLNPISQMEAIRTDDLDISMSSEPWVTRSLNDGHSVVWKDYTEVLPNFQFAVTLFGPSIMTDSHELGEKFMAAYIKAVRQLAEGKTDRNLQLLSEFTELDTAFLEEVCWPTFRLDGSINVESVLEFQSWLASEGVIDKVLSPEQFWDPRFIESVK